MDERKLIEELFASAPVENRCEYIRKDEVGPYCSQGFVEGQYITPARRLICDIDSLQLWCLDKTRCNKCIGYSHAPDSASKLNSAKDNGSERELTLQEKCEGKQLKYNVGSRVGGLCWYTLSMIGLSTGEPLVTLITLPLALDGAGDAITGHHHYLARKVYEAFGGKNWFGED